MNRITLRAGLLALVTASVVGVTACSSTGDSSDHDGMSGHNSTMHGMSSDPSAKSSASAAVGPHNKADVSFATDMIPHHGQAVEMADMALKTSKNPDVLRLAKAIKGAQDPEIQTMSGWLRGWNQPVPSTSMGAMDHAHMPGMMSMAEMNRLANATGTDFDKMWLTMMTTHHQGAITMAKTELQTGANPDSKKLAKSIITGQSAEVATMARVLAAL